MKHLRKLLLSAAVAVTALPSLGATVTPYSVDFEGLGADGVKIENHEWVPRTNWTHIVKTVEGYSGESYLDYTYHATGGYDGSGYIETGYQYDYNTYQYTNAGDMLVTPAVSGTITLQIKSSSYYDDGTVNFYSINADGTAGDVLYTATAEGGGDWKEVSFTVNTATKIGICAYQTNLDHFTATSADIEPQHSVSIAAVENATGETADADAQGKFNVSFKTVLRNGGDYNETLIPVELVDSADTSIVYGTPKAIRSIAIGALSDTLEVSAEVTTTDYKPVAFAVKELLSGTTMFAGKVTPIKYEPKINISLPAASSWDDPTPVGEGATQNFGKSRRNVTQTYNLTNDGAAQLNITAVEVPQGFSTTLAAQTVDAHKGIDFTITLDSTAAGNKAGEFVIKSNAADYTLHLVGTTVPEDTWFVDFEDDKLPGDMLTLGTTRYSYENWRVSSLNSALALINNEYTAEVTSSDSLKLVSPLLETTAGDSLQFDAAQNDENSFLNVYYSTDRKNWTLAKTIGKDGSEQFDQTNYSTSSWSSAYGFKTFSVDNLPAGNYYVAFEAGNVKLDNILGFKKANVAHDWMVTASDFPASGEVNSPYTASATFKNLTLNTEDSASYNAYLYVDGERVAEAPGSTVLGGESGTVSLTFTPRKDGTFKAYIDIVSDGYKVSTDTATITINKEQAVEAHQVGEPQERKFTTIPIAPAFNSEGQITYTAENLAAAGLKKGDKIKQIAFQGYATSSYTAKNLRVLIQNSTDGSAYTDNIKDTTNATVIYDGAYEYPKVGTLSGYYPVEFGDLITINLETPFVYDGNALVIYLRNLKSDSYSSTTAYLALDPNLGNNLSIGRNAYSESALANATYQTKGGESPVVKFVLAKEPVSVSGKVTNEAGNAIAGASVVLISDNVQYSGTTAADGTYSIQVFKNTLDYSAIFTAEGYLPDTVAVTMNGDNDVTDVDAVLRADVTSGINSINTVRQASTGNVYSIDGRLVRRKATSLEGLPAGIYIIDGKKMVVR